jgi:hypothetical protein
MDPKFSQASSRYRANTWPAGPQPADAMRASMRQADFVAFLTGALVGNGHTSGPLRRDGLRTRRAVHWVYLNAL